MSDSEFEAPIIIAEAKKKKKTIPTTTKTIKRKSTAAAASPVEHHQRRATSPVPYDFPPLRKNKKKQDLFNILQSEEAASSRPKSGGAVTSSFASRVSTGTSRRTASVTGDFFVDLKVYKTPDYVNNPADVRYKKALAAVKLQCDDSSPPWEALQAFLGQAWTVFEESEPVHYSDKISFK